MKDLFLRIKSMGIVGDALLINNRGDQIHTQLSGNLNRKMVQDLSLRVLQLFALQGAYIGADTGHLMLVCDDLTVFGFDLGPLVLIAVSQNTVPPEQTIGELLPIAQEFRNDTRLLAGYERKGIERRDLIGDTHLDEKARNLMGELKRSAV